MGERESYTSTPSYCDRVFIDATSRMTNRLRSFARSMARPPSRFQVRRSHASPRGTSPTMDGNKPAEGIIYNVSFPQTCGRSVKSARIQKGDRSDKHCRSIDIQMYAVATKANQLQANPKLVEKRTTHVSELIFKFYGSVERMTFLPAQHSNTVAPQRPGVPTSCKNPQPAANERSLLRS